MSNYSKIYHGTGLVGALPIDPGSPGYISNWRERLAKLYQQFSGLPNITALAADVFAPQVQAVEDAAQQLFSIISIDSSTGTNLDVIGAIVKQLRAGLPDAIYRFYIKARIKANLSSGRYGDIYGVFFLLYGLATSMVIQGDTKGTAIELTIKDVITAAKAKVGVGFLRDSKASGVRANLRWQESEDAALFRFDSGPGFDQGKFAGAESAD